MTRSISASTRSGGTPSLIVATTTSRLASSLRDTKAVTGRPRSGVGMPSGIPQDPFFSGSETEARRWSRNYRTLLIREDVTALERVQDLGNLELLMLRLPELVGSPLSINALREDLQVSHKTVAHWLQILERLYEIARLSPFGAPRIRAVKKEQKHYAVNTKQQALMAFP